jgi:hypothetical protein
MPVNFFFINLCCGTWVLRPLLVYCTNPGWYTSQFVQRYHSVMNCALNIEDLISIFFFFVNSVSKNEICNISQCTFSMQLTDMWVTLCIRVFSNIKKKSLVVWLMHFLLSSCFLLFLLQSIQLLHRVADNIPVVFVVSSLYVLCVALWLHDWAKS